MLSNYHSLTIKQFIELDIITSMEADPIERKLRMLAAVTKKPYEYFESLPLGDLAEWIKELDKISAIQPDSRIRRTVKIKDQWFKVDWKLTEISAGQYFDLTNFVETDRIAHNMHSILACFLRPMSWRMGKPEPYNGANHKNVADFLYNNMRVKDAYPLMLFFCKFSNRLTEVIPTYLVAQVMKVRREIQKRERVEKQALKGSGTGLLL